MRLSNKVVLITGAHSGIGKAVALRFAEEGADLVLCDINGNDAASIEVEIKRLGRRVLFAIMDVRVESDWIAAFEKAAETFGSVDAVVNSAGVAIPSNIEDVSFEDWNKELNINLNGTFFGNKYGIRHMKNKGGSIINISSIEGIVGHPDYAAYSASKGAVRNLTKSAALHAGRSGYAVRVNSIHPGYIKTPMIGDDPEELASLARLHPIGFLGEPVDIANMALFLASNESRFATGAEFVIDGGFLAQ